MSVVLLACAGGAFGQADFTDIHAQSLDAFRIAHPGAGLYERNERITSVYGPAFSHGETAQQSVDTFLAQHVAMLGATRAELRQISLEGPDRAPAAQPVMYDRETGTYKFSLFTYEQHLEGVPVAGGVLKLLVRNEPGFPLVLARSDVRTLGDFAIDRAVRAEPQTAQALLVAQTFHPALREFTEPELAIWAGTEEHPVRPRLAVTFVGESPDIRVPGYEIWRFYIDAATGEILHQEDLKHHNDIPGVVTGRATTGDGADVCGGVQPVGMPYALVTSSAGPSTFADADGNFLLANPGGGTVTVSSQPRGQWFRVFNQQQATTNLSTSTSGGPVTFEHNASNAQFTRAEVNAYVHSNIVRDFTLEYNPSFPTISTQQEFTVNVNISNSCNAFYNGSSINFYVSGGGCANTAFSSVVYHEYGHHLVNRAGSGQGQYGEGFGDTVGMLIQDNPILGIGFQNNCGAGIRSAVNNIQYPCSGGIHFCGQLLSGSIWDVRNALLATNPTDYLDIVSNLAINSVLLHTGTLIAPDITIAFLTLDDDDADITNGTPHYQQINAGFSAHNMPAPPILALRYEFIDGVPDSVNPAGDEVTVKIVANSGFQTQPGAAQIFIDVDGDGSFSPFSMQLVSSDSSGDTYLAPFPATDCGESVNFYFSAQDSMGVVVTSPSNAPGSAFTALSATSIDSVLEDDFETDLGWTVWSDVTDGEWERGVPVGGGLRGDPPTDYDGSGQCYLTGNRPGDSDVDNGSTILTSPVMDASGGEAYISYARWYSNNFGANPNTDIFVVELSNNNGASWVNLETVGPAGPESNGGWYYVTYRISDFIEPTSTMRVRFIASDLGPQAVVEAAVDAVSVRTAACDTCPGDANGDGVVDFADLSIVLGAFGDTGVGIPGDLDGDGAVNFGDLAIVLGAFGQSCF
ncbi:MAG: hypothetical protein EA379_04435 [Phycisphaerales bacterium]|nr:MAG: hypothetical protein EA379_04435 [Phycisphaerales bacterium]